MVSSSYRFLESGWFRTTLYNINDLYPVCMGDIFETGLKGEDSSGKVLAFRRSDGGWFNVYALVGMGVVEDITVQVRRGVKLNELGI